MPSTVDLTGLDRLIARFRALAHPDPTPLLVSWTRIIDDDNRKGVMAGTDHMGNPMPPVTYRPKAGTGKTRLTKAQRNDASGRLRRGAFGGFGPAASGLNNNLSSAEYRLLSGPPLAPRGPFSRVITNLKTRFGQIAEFRYEAVGYWDQVVSTRGVEFLGYHFRGQGRRGSIPVRDLRGVRPEGMAKARKAAVAWMISEIRRAGL